MGREPYRPSNGTEGMLFEFKWCESCIRHPVDPGAKKQCVHLFRALAGEDNGRWFVNESGQGECTAFKNKFEAYRTRSRTGRAKKIKNQRSLFAANQER